MNRIIKALIITLILTSSSQIKKTETPLHPIVSKVKNISLYTDRVNWEEVNAKFVSMTEGKESVADLKEGLQYLINSLGDKHGSFRSAKDHSIVVYYTGKIKGVDNRNGRFVNTVINDVSAQFSYQLLDNKVGYLKVVGIGGGNVKAQADFIRKGLIDLKYKGVDKWILDLRFNGGGNMEPMIAGLAPLLGDSYIGGATNNQNEITRNYYIKNGQFNNNGRIVCPMKNTPKIDDKEKVAVLLSRYTISSGELVAVAFKGRRHTRFFGEPTAGYTTGNSYERVTNDLILTISEDVFMDRNKVIYHNKVKVDELIEFQHNTTLKDDNQVNRAIEWLNE